MPPSLLSPLANVSLQSANAGMVTPPAQWASVAAGAPGQLPGSDAPATAAAAAIPVVPAALAGLPARPGLRGMRKIVARSAPYAGPIIAGGGLYLAVTSQFARFGGGNGPAMPVNTYVAETVAGSLLLGAGSALTAAGIWLTRERNAAVGPTSGATNDLAHAQHDEENTRPSTPVV